MIENRNLNYKFFISWFVGIAMLFGAWLLGTMAVTILTSCPRILAWVLFLLVLWSGIFLVGKSPFTLQKKIWIGALGFLLWFGFAVIFKVEAGFLALFGSPPNKAILAMAEKYNPNWIDSLWLEFQSERAGSAYEADAFKWELCRTIWEIKLQKQHWERLQQNADEKAKSMSDRAGSREAK
jgi:hypothetical protein